MYKFINVQRKTSCGAIFLKNIVNIISKSVIGVGEMATNCYPWWHLVDTPMAPFCKGAKKNEVSRRLLILKLCDKREGPLLRGRGGGVNQNWQRMMENKYSIK